MGFRWKKVALGGHPCLLVAIGGGSESAGEVKIRLEDGAQRQSGSHDRDGGGSPARNMV